MKATKKVLSLMLALIMVLTSAFVTLPVFAASTSSSTISLTAGQAPSDVSGLDYVNGGKFLVWKDSAGKIYSHTEKVNAAVTLTASYSKFHVATVGLGSLSKAIGRDNGATITGPIVRTEGDIKYNRYTMVFGQATVAANTQIHFDIADYIAPKYSETPYVAYKYRTSINMQTWKSSFSTDGYKSSIKWEQSINGIIADEQWHLAVHKPASFGGSADASLLAFRVSPYNNTSGITITANQYVDIEYVGFFESEDHAKAFDINKYTDSFKITYKAKIDGKVVTIGEYVPGSVVKLPAVNLPANKVLTGYKKSDGTIVTEAVVTTEIVSYTSVLRNLPKGDYINERGNLANLKAKLDEGSLDVAFLGGSVTAGAGASGRGRWGSQVIDYLRAEYPTASITEINLGIGGTGSRLGSFRLAQDVIAQKPDLVFVEFMLNDAYNNDYSGNTYRAGKNHEYVIRTIREQLPDTEIITVFITDKSCAQNYGYGTVHPIGIEQEKIAAKYNVTTIDVGRYMLESIFDGNKVYNDTTWKTYVTDSVHPGNLGYAIYAELINGYLDGIKSATGAPADYTVPDSFVYEKAEDYLPITIPLTLDGETINPALKNVKGLTLKKRSGTPAYKYLLDPTGSTASFEFEFTGTELSLYMDSPNAGSSIKVTVDGKTVTQDGKDDTNGPKEFFLDLENKKHTAKVELSGITSDGNVIGILVGAIADEGDVDGDGAADAVDYVKMSRAIAGWSGFENSIPVSKADFDGDGALTTVDTIILARYIAGWKGYENLFRSSGN